MIYSVDFQEIAGRISYVELCKYVSDLGWNLYAGKTAAGLKIFQKIQNGIVYQIKVPCNRDFSDYPEAIYKAVSTIAEIEGKSVEQIILELLNPLSDIIRVRHIGSDVENGSILIENGINLYENAKKLLTNAALDILSYKKIYKGRTPEGVAEFISRCRYGQTEFGSYVISLVCPFVKVDNNEVQQLSLFSDEEISAYSLTRKVTNRVIESIEKIKDTIDKGEDLSGVIESMQNPISVSFLDSLTNLNISTEDSALEVSVKWAPTVKLNRASISKATISHDYYAPLKTIVEKYKSEDASTSISIEGRIGKLVASPNIEDRTTGQAQLVYIDENSHAKKITLDLGKEEYDLAIHAHSEGRTVRANGEISGKKMINVALDVLE